MTEQYSFGGSWHPGLRIPELGMSGLATTPSSIYIAGAGTAAGAAINATSTAGQIGAAITAGADIGALFAGPAGPIVAAIGNFIGPLIAKFSGCGQTCTQATQIANSIGGPMAQAFQAYMNAPVHYYSAQQAFLAYFQTLMTKLQQSCSNPALGTAGQNCIADNSPSACHWKASPGGWNQDPTTGEWDYAYWGAAGSGSSCWNPWTGIYNEVLNDPTVVPDPDTGLLASTSGTVLGMDTTGSLIALAAVGLILALVLL